MITLIPTFAGGLLQLIKLGLISVSMIRFFSISQLVTDGIIILLFLSFPILIFITLFLNQGLFTDLYDETDYDFKDKFKSILKDGLQLSRLILYSAVIIYFVYNLKQLVQLNNLYKLMCINAILLFVFKCLFLFFFKSLQKLFLIDFFFGFCNICFLILALYSLNLNYKLPDDISNFNLLIEKLEKEKCYSKKPEIIYFNDKFIFIELVSKSKREILVKKIDDLFDE